MATIFSLTSKSLLALSNELFDHQLTSDIFFDKEFLLILDRTIGIKQSNINLYNDNTNLEYTLTLDPKSVEYNLFENYAKNDICAQTINKICKRRSTLNMKDSLPIFRSADFTQGSDRQAQQYHQFLQSCGTLDSVIMPFGTSGQFHLCFYKTLKQGTFSEKEYLGLKELYQLLNHSYDNFYKLKRKLIALDVHTETNARDGIGEVILDSHFQIINCNSKAKEYFSTTFGTECLNYWEDSLTRLELVFFDSSDHHTPKEVIIKDHVFTLDAFETASPFGIKETYYKLLIKPNQITKLLKNNDSPFKNISAREMDIIEKLVEGMTYNEIADDLFLSPHTVRNHVHNILRKTCLSSKTQLVSTYLNIFK